MIEENVWVITVNVSKCKLTYLFPCEIVLKYNIMSFCNLNKPINFTLQFLFTCHI
jgi:hypothetical protein